MSFGIYLIIMFVFAAIFIGGIYVAIVGSQQGRLNKGRRSFLGGGSKDDHAVFLGVQLVIQIFGSDDLRAKLARLIENEDETDSADEKRRFIKSIASLLTENQYAWEYGFWDYKNSAGEAIQTFNQWRNEIEGSMATEAVEMGGEIDRLHRYSDHKEYLIVSMMLLIDNRNEPVADDVGDYEFRPTYDQLASPVREFVDNINQKDYFEQRTFKRLIETLRTLDPRAIERDGIYIYPGNAQDGLSSMDLLSESSWKYLTDNPIR